MLENAAKLVHCFLVLVLRTHIYLGQYNEERNFEEEAESDVLFCHFLNSHVRSHNHATEVRGEAS